MSNIFTYFTISLPFSSRDVSIAISNLLQMTTARWRHGSHSTQTYHSGVCPRGRALGGPSGDHRRYVKVSIGPHLDAIFGFPYPYRFFDASCSPVQLSVYKSDPLPVYYVILLSHVICES